MSLFPEEDVLTKEIETWRGFIDKLPLDKLPINSHDHPFPAEPLIMSLLLSQHKIINLLKTMIQSKQTDNKFEDY
jgi:hypothetical protein